MLSKEQVAEAKFGLIRDTSGAYCRNLLGKLIAEYEAANPPAPVVKCPACRGEMGVLYVDSSWHCQNGDCSMYGPVNDPDGAKVMALGRKPLPLDKTRQYHVYKGRAQEVLGYMGIDTAGDPIDLSEWFNA